MPSINSNVLDPTSAHEFVHGLIDYNIISKRDCVFALSFYSILEFAANFYLVLLLVHLLYYRFVVNIHTHEKLIADPPASCAFYIYIVCLLVYIRQLYNNILCLPAPSSLAF